MEQLVVPEKEIEQKLKHEVERKGGLCLKFVSPGWDGAPDRICLWPGGRVSFYETKKPGGRLRALQARRLEQLRRLGFKAEVIDSKEGAVGAS